MQSRPTLAVISASIAASAATLLLALSPAFAPQAAHDGVRLVELPRVVITGAREARVVELPRVVVQGERLRSDSVAGARHVQPVMAPLR